MEYGNGATGAADACVGMFVASALVSIIMYKTVKVKKTLWCREKSHGSSTSVHMMAPTCIWNHLEKYLHPTLVKHVQGYATQFFQRANSTS